MTKLTEIATWLDSYLNTKGIPDYPNAYNGLQAENDGTVTKVGSAVDASLKSIQKAANEGVDLLLVHHGLYWQGVERLKGAWREKCKLLLEHNIALYSSHIPLDIHPEVGNSALLAEAIGLTDTEFCHPWKGINLAVKGKCGLHRDELSIKLSTLLGETVFTCYEGAEVIDELYIISGGAGSELKNINEAGGKNFLTGEGSHWIIPYAEEEQMNLILGKHYLTETFGVEKLSKMVAKRFTSESPIIIRSNTYL